MSLHVLDTDTLSLLQERHAAVLARIAACDPHDIAVTIVSVEEQLSGWYRRLRRAKKPEELAKVYDRLTAAVRSLSRLPILSFSEAAIRQAKALQAANPCCKAPKKAHSRHFDCTFERHRFRRG